VAVVPLQAPIEIAGSDDQSERRSGQPDALSALPQDHSRGRGRTIHARVTMVHLSQLFENLFGASDPAQEDLGSATLRGNRNEANRPGLQPC
jgi:hypothetical protein